MKITHIEVIFLQKKLLNTMQISRGGFKIRNHTLVKVHTDSGISGLGEGIGNALLVKAILKEQMCDLAVGHDPFNIESLRKLLLDSQVYFERQGSTICAASAIEMACWDIKGKALGVPVYELLGGLYQNSLQTYASDVYWQEKPSDMVSEALRIVDLGHKAIKIHIGHGSPKEDYDRIQAIRVALGDGFPLMVDLNAGYNTLDGRLAALLWESLDITWLEEPINPNHIEAMADLRSKSAIPIASGENDFRTYGFKRLFELRAVDVAMPDIGRVGGLMETKNICALAETYGIPLSPHNFSSGVLLAATIHLMASTPNTQWLEIDTSGNAVYEELLTNPLKFNEGYVSVPDEPGLGVELKEETLNNYAVS